MENQNFKNYQFILGIGVLLIGILLSIVLSSPIRFLGVVFVTLAILYFAVVLSPLRKVSMFLIN